MILIIHSKQSDKFPLMTMGNVLHPIIIISGIQVYVFDIICGFLSPFVF